MTKQEGAPGYPTYNDVDNCFELVHTPISDVVFNGIHYVPKSLLQAEQEKCKRLQLENSMLCSQLAELTKATSAEGEA